MQDQYRRTIDYLRLSVTDKCNFRCVYCMPKESAISWMPKEEFLTDEEIVRLCRLFTEIGISKIKFTGGEPLMREGFACLAERIGKMEGIKDMTLTTNGFFLKEQMEALYSAGISGINISLDAADSKNFETVTGINCFEKVKRGIEEAKKYPVKLKINCVLARELNQSQWIPVLEYAKTVGADVRFIEMMPIGAGKNYASGGQKELLSLVEKKYGRLSRQKEKGNGPAVYYRAEKFPERIGFISAVTHKFCAQCNRIRLTADGCLKPCLQYDIQTDLKAMLRDGKTDSQIKEQIVKTVYQKPKEHQFEIKGKKEQKGLEKRTMSKIGG